MSAASEGEVANWIEGAVDLLVGTEGNAAGLLESTELPDRGEDRGLGCLSLSAGMGQHQAVGQLRIEAAVRQHKLVRGSDLVEELVA